MKNIEETIEKQEKKMDLFAEIVANKVIEKLNGTKKETSPSEKETLVEENDGEKRTIDYSSFEERIAKLN